MPLTDRDLLSLARTLHENRFRKRTFSVYAELRCDAEIIVLGQGEQLVGDPRTPDAKQIDRNTTARPIANILTHLDILARRTMQEGK
jgi:hypothetical protein